MSQQKDRSQASPGSLAGDDKGVVRMSQDDSRVVPGDGTASAVEKLDDALNPGYQAEFDPDEAEQAGAFVEDALSERDAAESAIDLVDATAPAAKA
jgi:hypothetical protein